GPRHCNGHKRRLGTPLTAGAVGKVSPAARSQETTHVRATFAEPRGRSWWRSGVFGACSLRAFLWEECPFCFFVRAYCFTLSRSRSRSEPVRSRAVTPGPCAMVSETPFGLALFR